MSSVNKVILVGNLGRDPETRMSQAGNKIVNFSIATSESWKDKTTGEKKEKTEWHNVVVFNEHLANIAENYLKKGSKVYIEGQLQTRKWEKDGVERYSTEIVLQNYRGELQMLDTRGEQQAQQPTGAPQVPTGGGETAPDAPLDDEIPFITPWGLY